MFVQVTPKTILQTYYSIAYTQLYFLCVDEYKCVITSQQLQSMYVPSQTNTFGSSFTQLNTKVNRVSVLRANSTSVSAWGGLSCWISHVYNLSVEAKAS